MQTKRKRKRQQDAEGASRERDCTFPRAVFALVQARRLFYARPELAVEERLTQCMPKLSALVHEFRSATPGELSAKVVSEVEALKPALCRGGGAARAVLRLGAILDGAYMELFISDQLSCGKRDGVPTPNEFLRAALLSPNPTSPCSECATGSAAAGPLLCLSCTSRNPQLAYVRLRSFEASQIGLARLTASALTIEGINAGPPSGTMRFAEPLGCDTLRKWQAAVRERVCAWSSFACPDIVAVRALRDFCRGAVIHEVGAGTGYWARYLTGHGLHVIATDVQPVDAPRSGRAPNEYHSRLSAWFKVAQADASVAAAAAGAAQAVLFLCYPPPTEMGLLAVRAFERAQGSRLALAGELRGDTGTVALEKLLSANWLLTQSVALPAYGDTAACLSLWRRKSAQHKKDGGEEGEQGEGQRGHVRVGVKATIEGRLGQPLTVTLSAGGCTGRASTQSIIVAAKTRPTSHTELIKALGSLGDTPYRLLSVEVVAALERECSEGQGVYIAVAEVKAARKGALEALTAALPNSSDIATTQHSAPSWPLTCESCGKAPSAAPMLRDRLTRSIVACNEACARSPATLAALERALADRHLPPLSFWEHRLSKSLQLWRPTVLI